MNDRERGNEREIERERGRERGEKRERERERELSKGRKRVIPPDQTPLPPLECLSITPPRVWQRTAQKSMLSIL